MALSYVRLPRSFYLYDSSTLWIILYISNYFNCTTVIFLSSAWIFWFPTSFPTVSFFQPPFFPCTEFYTFFVEKGHGISLTNGIGPNWNTLACVIYHSASNLVGFSACNRAVIQRCSLSYKRYGLSPMWHHTLETSLLFWINWEHRVHCSYIL